MSSYEYRVVVKRAGTPIRYKRYASARGAQRRLALYGPEPWTAFGANPDDQFCCSGYECCCGGVTVREHHQERRSGLPALEFAYIERREVGDWQADARRTLWTSANDAPDVAQPRSEAIS